MIKTYFYLNGEFKYYITIWFYLFIYSFVQT